MVRIAVPEKTANVNGEFWSSRERKYWTIALFFGLMLLFMSRTVGPVTMVALAKEFQWNKEVQGSVLSTFFWGAAMSHFPSGWLSDIYGGDNVLFWTCTSWITVTFVTPFVLRSPYLLVSSSTMYLFLRFFMGFFQGAFSGSMASLLGKKLETSHKSSTNGIINSGACIGSVVIGVAGSLLLDNVDWGSAFYCVGIAGITWLIIWRFTLFNRGDLKQPNDEQGQQSSGSKFLSVPWLSFLSHCPLWAMIFADISISICFHGLSTWLPSYFHDTFPQSKGWIFNVIPWLINSPCAFISGIWADYLLHKGYSLTCVRKFFNILAQLGAAFSLILLSHCESFPLALMFMTLAIGMTGFHNAGGMVLPQDMAPEYAGSVAGFSNTVSTFSVFGAIYFSGHVLTASQSWPLYFNVVAGVCILGCAIFTIFASAKRIQ
ncbi:solute carrier family 17 member 9-like [Dendronephthya gigantea]|uniref:solute carrier family 17 member 9-like n=1 Tax=Dendronephthya gigantea TaxID=151771 RepID=UPI0010693D47|nr:solute carrier family 17 member 9-like [Dendronephthya gigantea]